MDYHCSNTFLVGLISLKTLQQNFGREAKIELEGLHFVSLIFLNRTINWASKIFKLRSNQVELWFQIWVRRREITNIASDNQIKLCIHACIVQPQCQYLMNERCATNSWKFQRPHVLVVFATRRRRYQMSWPTDNLGNAGISVASRIEGHGCGGFTSLTCNLRYSSIHKSEQATLLWVVFEINAQSK